MLPGAITIKDGHFYVMCQPHIAIKLRRVFGGIQRFEKAGVFKLAATPAHAHELEWFASRYPMKVDPDIRDQYDDLVETEDEKLASIAEIERVGYVPREFALALPPRDYQRLAADMLLRTRQLLLADDLGVGKTVSSICALTAPGALPAAVVTMTHLPRQWERELARFMPKATVHRIRKGTPYAFDSIRYFEVDEHGKRRKVRPPAQPDILILNYAKLDGWAEHLSGMVRTVIFDECQELRHEGSNRYNAARALAAAVDMRMGLSATPVYNYGPEIFAVLNVLAPDALGSREEFFQEWCGGGGDGSAEGHEISFAMYTGQESETQKAESVRRFIAGDAKVLIISLRSGAGLDGLQHVCRTVVIGELDWSPQVHHQGVGRVHRDGQAEPVAAYYLVAEEGSDPVIADVLGIKEAQARGIRDPNAPSEAVLVGAADDHIKRLAEDVLRRCGTKSAPAASSEAA